MLSPRAAVAPHPAFMRLARSVPGDPVVVGAGAVFVVALLARIGVVLSGSGYGANLGYDDSVYYAAADALVHGRMPYADFFLLHPPGAMLFLSPFAAVGTIIGDHLGFIVASVFMSVLAATNAVLVVVVARRIGLHRIAAVVAGLVYAVYFGAVASEYSTRLEPLGNFLVLCGLLAFFGTRRASWLAPAVCGAAFAGATCVKIWWAVPLVLAVIACGRRFRARGAISATVGALAVLIIVNLPFFVNAPHAMFDMVVRDQLGRRQSGISPLFRLAQISSISVFAQHHSAELRAVLYSATALGAIAIVVLAWQVAAARPIVGLAVIQIVTLCLVPSWFYFYADYVTVAAALTTGAAVSRLLALRAGRRTRVVLRWSVWLPALVLAAALLAIYPTAGSRVRPFPHAAQLSADVRRDDCVMSDSPMALIELNVLSHDFEDGCPNWVDVTGRTYDVDRATSPQMDRFVNQPWQLALRRYLSDGAVAVLIRSHSTGLDHTTKQYLDRYGTIASEGNIAVFRERPVAFDHRTRTDTAAAKGPR